jgi:hypothetical protein
MVYHRGYDRSPNRHSLGSHRTKAEPGRGALGSASIDPGQHQFATNMTLASARTTLDDKVPAWLSPSGHDIETSLSRKRPDLGYRALLTS